MEISVFFFKAIKKNLRDFEIHRKSCDFKILFSLSIRFFFFFLHLIWRHLSNISQELQLSGELTKNTKFLQVYIGSSRCVVTLLDTRQLMCRAPPNEPAPTDEKGNSIGGSRPLLTVVIGSLRHELGLVEYETSAVR